MSAGRDVDVAVAERDIVEYPEEYLRIDMELGPGPQVLVLVRVLHTLGYTRVRLCPNTPGVFTAIDEQRFATLIVADVSPVADGYPVPRISPGRARAIHDLCLGYLMDHTRVHKVRADYVVLPSVPVGEGRLPITFRRGVSWAFASERRSQIMEPRDLHVAVLCG